MKTKSITVRMPENNYLYMQELANQYKISISQIVIAATSEYSKNKKYIDEKAILYYAVELAKCMDNLKQEYPEINFNELQKWGDKLCQSLSI